MADIGNFNAHDVPPATGTPDPLPPGTYKLMVTESEMVTTKAGDGSYLKLTMSVCDGPYQGRLVWVNLNLDNPNQTAVDIARRELSALCHAVGQLAISDSVQLHNIPFMADVKIKPAKGDFDAQNVIKKYHPARSAQQTTPAPPAQTPPVSTGGNRAPWQR